jgi:hypothetical protein
MKTLSICRSVSDICPITTEGEVTPVERRAAPKTAPDAATASGLEDMLDRESCSQKVLRRGRIVYLCICRRDCRSRHSIVKIVGGEERDEVSVSLWATNHILTPCFFSAYFTLEGPLE